MHGLGIFSGYREPLINYFTTALRAQLRRDKARLEGNGHCPCQESQRGIGATGAQPFDIYTSPFWAGANRPNNFVAMARQTYGYVVAIAPRTSTDSSPAQPRNS